MHKASNAFCTPVAEDCLPWFTATDCSHSRDCSAAGRAHHLLLDAADAAYAVGMQ